MTGLFYTGLALFLAAAVFLIVIGFWHRRQGWKTSGVALVVSLIAVFVWSAIGIYWIGYGTRVVTVVVRDATTKQPIANAAVRLFDEHEMMDPNASEGQTNEKGTCFLDHHFTSIGTLSPIRDTGGYYLWRDTLKIDALDYQGICEKLETFTGGWWPLYGPPIPVVEVNLKKNKVEK